MKSIYIILAVLLCSFTLPQQGNEFVKTYNFGSLTVKTGFCGQQSQIEILKSGTTVFKKCGGDGLYSRVDTLHINNDREPDYVFSYILEDYFNIGLLVSDNKGGYTYKILDKEHYSPRAFSLDLAFDKNKQEVEFIITDADKDGRKDIVANLHYDGKHYSPVKNYTDTINNKQLATQVK